MCHNQKFFVCKICGNLAGLVLNSGVPMVCCGEKMNELVANTVEASIEKHLPVVTIESAKISVAVGSILHPMDPDHHIEFIYLESENGGQRKCLKLDNEPKAIFNVVNDKPVAVYSYCNKHGLWKTVL